MGKLTSQQSGQLKCTLADDLRDFDELVCNLKKMESILRSRNFDATKSPLGKLTKAQIMAGYAALKTIEDCVSHGISGMR